MSDFFFKSPPPHTSQSRLKRVPLDILFFARLSLPEATNCHCSEKNWLIPPWPFYFTAAPEWRISFQWVLGLCLEKRKQQLLLSQGFLTQGPWKEEKNSLKKRGETEKNKKSRCQGKGEITSTTSKPLSFSPTHTQFLSLSLSATNKDSHKPFLLLPLGFLSLFRGRGVGIERRGNTQVQLLLSPVSLLAAMKDRVRIPSNYSVCEPPVSLRLPVDRAAKWVLAWNVNQRIWHLAGDLAFSLAEGLSTRWLSRFVEEI